MLITAHSGCDSTPDNSMDFVRHALQLQVDALEVDVWRKCGKLILSHDEPVDMNHPLMEEVFALVKEHPSMMVNCDLKEKGLEEPVYQLAESCGMEKRIFFSGEVRLSIHELMPEMDGRVLINAENLIHDVYEHGEVFCNEDCEELIRLCRKYGFVVINVNYRFATDYFVKVAEREHVGISFWTVTDREDIPHVIAWNPYNVTSRSPGLVLEMKQYRKQEEICSNT